MEFLGSSTSVLPLVPVRYAVYNPGLCVYVPYFPWDPDGFRLQDVQELT